MKDFLMIDFIIRLSLGIVGLIVVLFGIIIKHIEDIERK